MRVHHAAHQAVVASELARDEEEAPRHLLTLAPRLEDADADEILLRVRPTEVRVIVRNGPRVDTEARGHFLPRLARAACVDDAHDRLGLHLRRLVTRKARPSSRRALPAL